ncbi:MAG: AraC family transcriptional regulator ligand-binding domain-containing protein [Polyangiales bacterium]
MVWPFARAVRHLGLTLPEWAQAERAELAMARIPAPRAAEFLQWAVGFTGRPDLGVVAAELVEPGHFDLVELAARTQSTLEEGLKTLADLAPILHDAMVLKLSRGKPSSRVSLSFGAGPAVHPAGYDFVVASLVIAARRQIRGGVPDPICVRFPYAPSAVPDPHPLRRVLSSRFEFEAPVLEIEIDSALLPQPLFRANVALGQALQEAARELISTESAPSELVATIQTHVRAQLAAAARGDRTALGTAWLARVLHVSERTLRRKLSAEGVSLRELIDVERRDVALERLRDPALSTDQIAEQLGFTTSQAFHRAFRRWTGGSVAAHRAARRR